MYYEFEGRQNMKTLIFDDDCLIVGDSRYPYCDIESLEITSAQLFATYGIMAMRYKGKDISIAFPRSYAAKIRRAIKEMKREVSSVQNHTTDTDLTGRILMDPYDEIKKLKELLDLDIITEEEFAKKKKELFGL